MGNKKAWSHAVKVPGSVNRSGSHPYGGPWWPQVKNIPREGHCGGGRAKVALCDSSKIIDSIMQVMRYQFEYKHVSLQ